jgi:hypothetical protein
LRGENLEIKFEREQGNNYLVVQDNDLDFNSYQIQMLVNNNIKGVLCTSTRTVNMKQKIYYDITSKQSLNQLFEIRQLSPGEIYNLMNDIIIIIEELKNYMIGEEICMFSPQYVYVDAETLLPSICVIPKEGVDNGLIDLANMFSEMLIAKEEDKMAYCLYRFSKVKDKTVANLKQIMESSYSDNTNINLQNKFEAMTYDENKFESDINDKNYISHNSLAIKNEKEDKNIIVTEESKGTFKNVSNGTISMNTSVHNMLSKLRNNKVFYIGGIIIIFSSIILTMNLLCFKDKSGLIDTKTSAIVNISTLVIMGLIIYFVSNLLDKKNGDNEEEDEIEFVPVFEFIDNTIVDNKVIAEPCFTQFIDVNSAENKQTLLIDVETGLRHKIGDHPFIIGKLEGTVNLRIDNTVVSRLHAQLSKIDQEVIIQDLNSKNGTYVDGVRLDPGEQRKLTNNEIITIAEVQFQYHII